MEPDPTVVKRAPATPASPDPSLQAESPGPELTLKAVVLGFLLAALLAAANAYLGLFAGMTVSASIPAAVISMGLFSLIGGGILENNIVQTATSAGESVAAGVIFTLPAMVLLGAWTSFDPVQVTVIAALGGALGVLFTVPLRRALISDESEGLLFPEGVATAEVLRAGHGLSARPGTDAAPVEGLVDGERPPARPKAKGLRWIVYGGLFGGLFKLGEAGLGLWTATVEVASRVGASVLYFGSNLSPALLSVGYIVRLNVAALVFAGGALSWYVAIPIYAALYSGTDPTLATVAAKGPDALAWHIWTTQIRYLGVGAMVVGGLFALLHLRHAIVTGVRKGLAAARARRSGSVPRTERDVPMSWVLVGILLAIGPIFWLYQDAVGDPAIAAPMAVIMVVAGFLFAAVAGYMAGLVGSSNNPISGVTIATILFASVLLYWLMGPEQAARGASAAILIGAVVCCAAAIAGDNMQDLKTGHLLGATPWKQQVMQLVGTLGGAVVMAPVLNLLMKAYGFGPATAAHPHSLQAPQATLMASVARGVFEMNLPWTMMLIGAGIALVVIALDRWLEATNRPWRAPVLAVAVGIYLPFELSVPILIGGGIGHLADQAKSGAERGLLLASGLITGEALMGIALAVPVVLWGPGALAVVSEPLGAWPGVLGMVALVAWLLRVATRSGPAVSE